MSDKYDLQAMQDMIESLESQLIDLYEERQRMPSQRQQQQLLASLEAQLVDLYAERAELPMPLHQAKNAIASLEAQVISLVDERLELESQVAELLSRIERFRGKSKVLGAAIMEAALFDSPEASKKAA